MISACFPIFLDFSLPLFTRYFPLFSSLPLVSVYTFVFLSSAISQIFFLIFSSARLFLLPLDCYSLSPPSLLLLFLFPSVLSQPASPLSVFCLLVSWLCVFCIRCVYSLHFLFFFFSHRSPLLHLSPHSGFSSSFRSPFCRDYVCVYPKSVCEIHVWVCLNRFNVWCVFITQVCRII